MQHRIFHQTTWFRATGACLLAAAMGIASWLDVKTASALPLKIIQIRPMQPAFRVLPERLPARRLEGPEDFHKRLPARALCPFEWSDPHSRCTPSSILGGTAATIGLAGRWVS
jgi:hypothetical protein